MCYCNSYIYKYAGIIADDETLETFENIIKTSQKKIFIACDSLDYKLKLDEKYPGKLSFLRGENVHVNNDTKLDSPTPFLEFFLISMCPFIYLTGGPSDMTKFSTFGYMAAVYGNVDTYPIFNGSSQLQSQ